jgi:hypothetical protein
MPATGCNALATAIAALQVDHDSASEWQTIIGLIVNRILGAGAENEADIVLRRALSFVNKCFHRNSIGQAS